MKAMKSQAIAFLLGFALTTLVLFLIPGMTKKMSQVNHRGNEKLASVLHDSTAVTAATP